MADKRMKRRELPGSARAYTMELLRKYFLSRSRTSQALIITALYCMLSLIALYGPIDRDSTFMMAFDSQYQARQAIVGFVELLFWPLVVLLALTAGRAFLDFSLARLRK